MLSSEPIVEPPAFEWGPLIEALMEDCDRRGVSPVRYLQSDGDAPRAVVPGVWRPNLLRGCKAKQVYKALKVPSDPAGFSAQRQFRFDRGHVFEAWFLAYIRAMEGMFGITAVETQAVSCDYELGVGGKCDVRVKRHGFDYIVEVKSKENDRALNSITAPESSHSDQLNDYMHMDGVRAGWVIYFGIWMDDEGRTSIRVKEFFQRYDPERWAKTRARVMMLDWFRADPTRLAPRSSRPYLECGDCPWQVPCNLGLAPEAALTYQKQRGL